MTAPRSEIEASLAERGRPVDWATEQEAAVLCGMNPQTYRRRLPTLEKQGFPGKDPMNGRRFIPAIRDFWAKRIDMTAPGLAKSSDQAVGDNDNGRQPGKWGASSGSPVTRTGS